MYLDTYINFDKLNINGRRKFIDDKIDSKVNSAY